jgi:hypothetical protein
MYLRQGATRRARPAVSHSHKEIQRKFSVYSKSVCLFFSSEHVLILRTKDGHEEPIMGCGVCAYTG